MAAHTSRLRKLVTAGFLLAAGLAGLAYGRLTQANDHGGWEEVWSATSMAPPVTGSTDVTGATRSVRRSLVVMKLRS